MKNLTLEHITDCCHGTYIGTEEQQGFEVTGVVIDSRKVEAEQPVCSDPKGEESGWSYFY